MTLNEDEKEMFSLLRELEFSKDDICGMLHQVVNEYFETLHHSKVARVPVFVYHGAQFGTGLMQRRSFIHNKKEKDLLVNAFDLVKHFSH